MGSRHGLPLIKAGLVCQCHNCWSNAQATNAEPPLGHHPSETKRLLSEGLQSIRSPDTEAT